MKELAEQDPNDNKYDYCSFAMFFHEDMVVLEYFRQKYSGPVIFGRGDSSYENGVEDMAWVLDQGIERLKEELLA